MTPHRRNLLLRRRAKVSTRPSCVALWRASAYDSTRDALIDLRGNGLHARFGGSVGADNSDPLRLPLAPLGKRLYVPGTAGNRVTGPDVDVSGDIEIIWEGDTTWAGVSLIYPVSKSDTATTFTCRITSTTVAFQQSLDGTVSETTTPVEHGFTGAQRAAFKWTRAATSGLVEIYKATTHRGPWTLLLSEAKTGGALANTVDPISLGARNTGGAGQMDGNLYYASYATTIGGTPVCEFDATKLTDPYLTHVDAQGNTWTLNRPASGRKLCVVDRDILLFGGDDYLEIVDNDLLDFSETQAFTLAVAFRRYGSIPGSQAIIRKSAGGARWDLDLQSSGIARALASDGTSISNADTPAPLSGVATLTCGVRSVPAKSLSIYVGNTQVTVADTTGSLANSAVVRIGSETTTPGIFLDAELFSAAVFREALSAADLFRLARELGVNT